jgi:hypothetical protein
MGRPTPAQDHVHLYINGLYWGFYNIIEKPNASYFAEHFGGEKEEYDVLQHQGGTVDGNRQAWNEMMSIARGGLPSDEAVEDVAQYVDIEAMIDYLLVNFYAGNVDWDQNNWFGGRHRSPEGRFIFFTWDAERTFLNVHENVTTKNVSNQPTELHQRLRANDEYRLQFADRVHRHFFNHGVFTAEQAEARWMRWADEIERALWAEAARWGDAKRSQPYTPDGQWIDDLNKFRENYFPRRTEVVLDQLRRQGLYPDIEAPAYDQHGGIVPAGLPLTMSAPEGAIVYTTDGSDPRLKGGAVSPGAAVYAGALMVNTPMTVKSRVLRDGQWSALNEATFRIASAVPVRITELNYNPHSDRILGIADEVAVDSDRYEFIELTNVGTDAVDLAGLELQQNDLNGRPQGIRFQFAPQTLGPGQRVVVVGDREAFTRRYGPDPRIAAGADGEDGWPGEFGGNLENRGEQVTLVDSEGHIIQQFSYSFAAGWPARANGGGSSLEIVDPSSDPDDPRHWRASVDFGGSPAKPGSSQRSRVALNELLASPIGPGGDLVELRNLTATDIDAGGWYLSDSEDDYLRYRIPNSTVIPALGHISLDVQTLGLDLSGAAGGVLLLTEADSSGRPVRYSDRAEFGPSLPGVSLGPPPTSSGPWIALDHATFGRQNSGPYVSDVVISEIDFQPLDPDGDGPRYDADDFQYVELTNISNQPRDISNWRLDGDIQFTFPPSTVLPPSGSLPVVAFRSGDVGMASVFRFTTGMSPTGQLVGRFRGELPADQGTVRLIRPLDPEDGNSREIVLEQVKYQASAPWPEILSDDASLHRTRPQDAPSLPSSWRAGQASPGEYQMVDRITGDSNQDGRFDLSDLQMVWDRGKYLTASAARWEDGDWNGDGSFDQLDVVFALRSGASNFRTLSRA